MFPDSEWFDSLKVGDEVAFNDFSSSWWIAQITQIGKGKGRRFKIVYGREKFDLWLNDHGRASSGSYSFAHIEQLTDKVRQTIIAERLRRTVMSKAASISKGKELDKLSAETLQSINGLLDLALDLIPKP